MKRSVAVLMALGLAGWAAGARANINIVAPESGLPLSGENSWPGNLAPLNGYETATFGLQTMFPAPDVGWQTSRDYTPGNLQFDSRKAYTTAALIRFRETEDLGSRRADKFPLRATAVPEPGSWLAAASLLALPLSASVMRILKRKRQG